MVYTSLEPAKRGHKVIMEQPGRIMYSQQTARGNVHSSRYKRLRLCDLILQIETSKILN